MAISDFSTFVSDHTRGFTGRQWVLEEIDHWLADPDAPQLFLLTGEPGVGKSAIAARLTQVRQIDAAHFCIARQASTIDPLNFARSLSHQLTHNDAFSIHLLADQGLHLDVKINVQKNYGQVIGVRIEQMVINAPSAVEAFNRAVVDPIQAMVQDGYSKQIVILIDALDEAMQFLGRETIVNLLANTTGLPPQIRFILTSRPEYTVMRQFERQNSPYFLLDAGCPENIKDIRSYVHNQIKALSGLKTRLDEKNITPKHFEQVVTTSSQGNFLYLTWLLPGVANGTQPVDDLTRLPVGLDGIYRQFLRTRTLGNDIRQWRYYRPLLGILAMAKTALTEKQLAGFTGLDPQTVADFILDAGQFLDPVAAQKGQYQLYHQSLVDFLVDRQRAEEFWIDPDSMHQLIVDFYKGQVLTWAEVDWSQVDDYGLMYLSQHLYALRELPEYDTDLYRLICQSFMQAKRKRTGSHRAFANDVALSLQAAERMPEPDLGQVIRSSLLYSTLGSIATQLAPEILGLLARLGRATEAEDFAALIQVKEQQSQAYIEISQVLLAEGNLDEARRLASLASDAALAISNASSMAAALKKAAPILGQTGSYEQAVALVEKISQSPVRTEAITDLAEAVAATGAHEPALGLVNKLNEPDEKVVAHIQIVRGLAHAGKYEQAIQLAGKISHPPEKDLALCTVAESLAQHGFIERALSVTENIYELDLQGVALRAVVWAHIQNGQFEQAYQTAMSIVDEPFRVESLGILAASLANADDFDHFWVALESMVPEQLEAAETARSASSVATSSSDPWTRAMVKLQSAQLLRQYGDKDETRENAQSALEAARQITSIEDRVPILLWIAETLDGLGKDKTITVILSEVESAILGITDIEAHQDAQFKLAQTEAQLGALDRAARRIDQAVNTAFSWDDLESRNNLLGRAASLLADFGDLDGAMAVINRIGPLKDIQDPLIRASAALIQLSIFLQLEEEPSAQAAFQMAFGAVTGLEVAASQADIWINLAYYAYHHDADPYQPILAKAEAAAHKLPAADDRANAFIALSRLASYGPQPGRFNSNVDFYEIIIGFISLASQASNEIEDPVNRISLLSSLVSSLYTQDDPDMFWEDDLALVQSQTLELLDSLVDQAAFLETPDERSEALNQVASASYSAGRVAQARQLIAEAIESAKEVADADDQAILLSEAAQTLANLAREVALKPARINALIEVAQHLSWLGKREQAAELSNEALSAAVQRGHFELEKIMPAYALSDQFEQTIALAQAIEKSSRGGIQSDNIIKTLLDILPSDRPLGRSIHIYQSSAPIETCAVSLTNAGSFDQARQLVNIIKAEQDKEKALIQVSQALIDQNLPEQAEEIVNRLLASSESLDKDDVKMAALSSLSQALVDTHHLDQAISISATISSKNDRLAAMEHIAQNLVVTDDLHQALNLATAIADPHSQAVLSTHIAETLIQTQQNKMAVQVLSQAEHLTGQIKSRRNRIIALAQIAQAWLRLGEEQKASLQVDQALAEEQAKQLRSNQDKSAVQTTLIRLLIETGRESEAAKRIKPALEVISHLKERQQGLALKELALALTQVVDEKMFTQVYQRIKKIRSRRDRVVALSGVILARGRSGQIQAALDEAEEAMKIAEAIKNERNRMIALRELVLALVVQEEVGRHWSGLHQLPHIAQQIRDSQAKVDGLRTALWALTKTGIALDQTQILKLFLSAMDASRLVGRQAVFSVLSDAAPFLAQQTQGETPWRTYQSIQEIDGWWASSLRPAT